MGKIRRANLDGTNVEDVLTGLVDPVDITLDSPTTQPGDVSGNGAVTAYDASLVLQHVVGLIGLSAIQQAVADVSRDGTVSALDAALILQIEVVFREMLLNEEKGSEPIHK